MLKKMFFFFSAVLLVAGMQAKQQYKMGFIDEDLTKVPFMKESQIKVSKSLPSSVDNRDTGGLPPVGNQLNTGSCTAWTYGYYVRTYQEWEEKGWDVTLPEHQGSPEFLYNHINEGGDNGSTASEAMNFMKIHGIATMKDMPYDESNMSTWGDETANFNALNFRIESAEYINTYTESGLQQVKQYLADGHILGTAIMVYDNFQSIEDYNYTYCLNDLTGNDPGGHAVTIVGYDDNKVTNDGTGAFLMVNSWGEGWGDNGFWWFSYEAMMSNQIGRGNAVYPVDKIGYEPKLVVKAKIDFGNKYGLVVKAGTGNHNTTDDIKDFFPSRAYNMDQPFGEDERVVLDVTDFYDNLDHDGADSVFTYLLDIRRNGGSIEYVSFLDIPNNITKTIFDMPIEIPSDYNPAVAYSILNESSIENVTDLTATQNYDKIDLSWTPVTKKNFASYMIFKNDMLIEELTDISASSYVDEVSEYETYEYSIAVKDTEGYSDISESVFLDYKRYSKNLVAGNGYNNIVPLYWEKPDDYTGFMYYIERKATGESEFTLIDSTLANEYLDETATSGTEYNYRIDAYKATTGYDCSYSNVVIASPDAAGYVETLTRLTNAAGPVIDGVINSSEWENATVLPLSTEADSKAYLYEADGYLYIAIDDKKDLTDNNYDMAAFYFDFNNDGLWNDGDGYFKVYKTSSSKVKFKTITGTYPDGIETGSTITFEDEADLGFDSNRQYEMKIDLSNPDFPFTNDNFGMAIRIYNQNSGEVTGTYPEACLEFCSATLGSFTKSAVGIDDEVSKPARTELVGNYPNPFNPETKISYTLANQQNVKLAIYNYKGQLVNTLVNSVQKAGFHTVNWNGNNSMGRKVASGVYYIKLVSDKKSMVKKAIMLK